MPNGKLDSDSFKRALITKEGVNNPIGHYDIERIVSMLMQGGTGQGRRRAAQTSFFCK